ncbi:COR domain-containing protein [Verrucomicrobium spinosum]|uniref:COR domain-containing protein n=1 Tax=Verrucomicrobium spinosum TaxID=2736 RepID=UPI0009EB616B
MGIILHYGEDARLKDTTVLKPQWVTSGVYRLLRFNDGTDASGVLTLSDSQP